MRIRFGVKHNTSNKMKEIMPVDMVEELIPELLAEEEMNDAEIEQLEVGFHHCIVLFCFFENLSSPFNRLNISF